MKHRLEKFGVESREQRSRSLHQKRAVKRKRLRKAAQEKSHGSVTAVSSQTTESVFLNVPYDVEFEELFLAYVVGLTSLGLIVKTSLAVQTMETDLTVLSS